MATMKSVAPRLHTSIGTDEDTGINQRWLQRALATSIMGENDCDELVASKESNTAGRPILVGSVYLLLY